MQTIPSQPARFIYKEGDNIRADQAVKELLKYVVILAPILKGTVNEVMDKSKEEISNLLKQEDIEVSNISVNPRFINDKICCQGTENCIKDKGLILYDIRFDLIIPVKKGYTKILVNLEAQQNWHPGYDLVSRGVYYAASMICAQLNVEFKNGCNDKKKYDNIKKVYSIWLCMNCPKYIENTIASFNIQKEILFTINPDLVLPARFDLATVVMIYLSRDYAEVGNPVLDMLNVLVAVDLTAEEKIRLLEERGVKLTEEVKEGFTDMCNWSEGFKERWEEKGIKKGLEEGIKKGKEEGKEEGLEEGIKKGREEGEVKFAVNAVNNGTMGIEAAAEILNVTVEKFRELTEQYGYKFK